MSMTWNFDNSYEKLPSGLYTKVMAEQVKSPVTLIFNRELFKRLFNESLNESLNEGSDEPALSGELEMDLQEIALMLSGNHMPEGAAMIAQAYGGHQFGHFNILGDGRAVLFGEHVTPKGERFDIQLKGSGRTVYSRGGDGKASVGPMLREYLISEAMHASGIPTTRSLAVIRTGEWIMREKPQPGAILTRVASSHIRVGTFQYAAARLGVEALKALADYTMARHYPESRFSEEPYLHMFEGICMRQAALIAKWHMVGFVHGVMNTDNMSICGETIDYGPCAFMERYEPATVFSSIDTGGRYAFGNQPQIALWNLARLAEAMLPLFDADEKKAIEKAQAVLSGFMPEFQARWTRGMLSKLGLDPKKPIIERRDGSDESDDSDLARGLQMAQGFLTILKDLELDYTNAFAALTTGDPKKFGMESLFASPDFERWNGVREEALERAGMTIGGARETMKAHNPAVIPRNSVVETALKQAEGSDDLTFFNQVLEAIDDPYAYSESQIELLGNPAPQHVRHVTYCGT